LCTVLSAAAALGIGLASTASADTINFNPTGGATPGGSNPGTSAIGSLQWGAGDAVALNSITSAGGGSIIGVGSTFQLYFQLVLNGLNGPNGSPLGSSATTGLNTNYQITEVASVSEVVQTLGAGNATATFVLAGTQSAQSGLKIYYTDLTGSNAGATKASFIDGTGFNPNGGGGAAFNKVILSATINGLGSSSTYTDQTKNSGTPVGNLNQTGPPVVGGFTATKTDVGGGSTGLTMSVNSVDTTFFQTPNIFASFFATIGTQDPFQQVPPSTAFNRPNDPLGTAPTFILPNPGATNGTSGPDFLLQLNGTPQSFAAPEPASLVMALSALVIVPLTTWQVRRRRAQS